MKASLAASLLCFTLVVLAGCEKPPSGVPAVPPPAVGTDEWIATEPAGADEWAKRLSTPDRWSHIELPAVTGPVDWSLLASQTSLRWFRLNEGGGGELIDALAEAGAVEILNLPRADLTPYEAAALGRLSSLRQLRLGNVAIDAATLQQLPTLRHLHLLDTTLTPEAVMAIGQLPRLESLYLDRVVTDRDVLSAMLEGRPDLHLHIDQLHLDGSGH